MQQLQDHFSTANRTRGQKAFVHYRSLADRTWQVHFYGDMSKLFSDPVLYVCPDVQASPPKLHFQMSAAQVPYRGRLRRVMMGNALV